MKRTDNKIPRNKWMWNRKDVNHRTCAPKQILDILNNGNVTCHQNNP